MCRCFAGLVVSDVSKENSLILENERTSFFESLRTAYPTTQQKIQDLYVKLWTISPTKVKALRSLARSEKDPKHSITSQKNSGLCNTAVRKSNFEILQFILVFLIFHPLFDNLYLTVLLSHYFVTELFFISW
jgi:hypothetical protein